MKASPANVKKGNVIVFTCDEYRNGNPSEYDGHVISVGDDGVNVIYLSGYKSQNDFIKWPDVLAKLDKRKEWIKLTNAPYKGQFLQFSAT